MDLPGDLTALDVGVEPLALETPQRHDDGSGSAGEDLTDPARLDVREQPLEADGVLDDAPPGVAQQADDGTAGGALKDRPGQTRRMHGPLGIDDHDVHATELLDVLLRDVIEEANLVAALLVGLLLRKQGGGVVAPGLGRSGSSASGTVVLGADPYGDGLKAMGEVGARGRGDDVVVDHLRRTHSEECLGGEGEGTQIEGLPRTRGHPGGIGAYQIHQGGHEVLL